MRWEKMINRKKIMTRLKKIAAVIPECPRAQKKRSLAPLHLDNPPVVNRVKRRLCFTSNNDNSETISSLKEAETVDKWLKEELAKIYAEDELYVTTKQLENIDLKK